MMGKQRWKIEQLRAVVEAALAAADVQGPDSKRVRAVPDTRTIRYYTTLGLLDRPAEMRGRTAYYDRRHALQLVCVKRLQSTGLSLAEVQHRLAGAGDQQLQKIAGVPNGFWDTCEQLVQRDDESPVTTARASAATKQREPAFWTARPAVATAAVVAPPQTRVRLPLGVDVVLEIPGDAQSVATALPQLTPLIEPLIRKLQQLGLAGPVEPAGTANGAAAARSSSGSEPEQETS